MRALMRSFWDEPRPPDAPARVWRDWVLVGLLVAAVVVEGVLRTDLPAPVLQTVVMAAAVPLLLWRRSRPLLALAVFFAASHGLALVTGDTDGMYSAVVALLFTYALVRWGSGREIVIGLGIVLIATVSSMVVGPTTAGDVIGGSTVLLTSVALGAAFRYRARARARDLDQVALRERERLARDLHDTVAHHVSAIAIRAQAGLATAASGPEAATEALRLIEAEASVTLTEMRSMVKMLRRDEPAELSPTPRIDDLHTLARQAPEGPPVTLDLVGEVDGVSAPVQTAVYRLAQESVTNARRHARAATRIDVRVVADDSWVHLRVSDDGEGGADPPTGPGFGLRGMVERAHLVGGTCEAGPGPDRGWTVAAVLPRHGPRA